MVLVCLSHFASVYSRSSGFDLGWIYYATMAAAPTFMILSGILLGYFYVIKRESFQSVIWDFLDRGFFILFVARLLILLAFVPRDGFIGSFRNVFITDAIAFNIIVGPMLVSRLNRPSRLGLACICWAASWIIMISWNPASFSWEFVKEGFFGEWLDPHIHALNFTFPVAPWFGLYLVGTVIGETLGDRLRAGKTDTVARFLMLGGLFNVASSLAAKTVFLVGKKYMLWSIFTTFLAYALTSPTQKSPPSLAYFCFYGGCGTTIIGLSLYLERSNLFPSFARLTALVGRNSLLVFVGQYYIYYVFFHFMNLGYSAFWPIYFFLSMVCVVALALVGDVGNLNKYFKVPAHRFRPGFDGAIVSRYPVVDHQNTSLSKRS